MNDTDPATTAPICGHCGTITQQRHGQRHAQPWCAPCGIWLVRDHTDTQWVSFAEREHRLRQADAARVVAASAHTVTTAAQRLRTGLPNRWRLTIEQPTPHAPYRIAVDPPPGAVDATAFLLPPHHDGGWTVRVHNRTQRIDYPLYRDGGAHAAYHTTAEDALYAAINALHIDIDQDRCDPEHP